MILQSLPALANHLWQSTLFAAAVALLTFATRKNHASLRHNLWLAASLKFLVPFSLIVAAIGPLAPTPSLPVAHAPLLPVIGELNQPFAQITRLPDASRPMGASETLAAVLLLAWACGVLVHLQAWCRQWLRMRRIAKAATPLTIQASVPVLSTSAGIEPGVFGIRRPVLLLPEGITEHLTPAQLDAVLVHELSHVRRRDNLTAALQMLVEMLFWFHPLVWWISRNLMEERERACDEEVLRRACNRQSYAEGILNVCKLYAATPRCASGVSGAGLRKRIEAIMTHRGTVRLTPAKQVLLAMAALAAFSVPVIIGIVDPGSLRAQPAAAFEVVSIKPNTSTGPARIGWKIGPDGRLHAENLPVVFLIASAYDVPFQSPQLAGLPDWVKAERFDIDALPAKGAIPPGLTVTAMNAAVRPMLIQMLADRFKLVVHRDSKDLPVYAITVAKGGPKLKASSVPAKECEDPSMAEESDCHNFHGGRGRGIHGRAADLDDLAMFVSNWTDRPLVNRTGIRGLFEFDTEGWVTMEPRQPRPDGLPDPEAEAMMDPTKPTIFTLLGRLGLKLEQQTSKVTVYVVDQIERPTAN